MTIPRNLKAQIDELNLEIVSIRSKKHFCIRLRNSSGATGTITTSATPSDYRACKNFASRLRRFAHHGVM